MSDEHFDEDSSVDRQLEAISPLFLKGWAKRHPIPERDRTLIAQAFSQTKTAPGGSTGDSTGQTALASQKQASKSHNKTQGPSHSH